MRSAKVYRDALNDLELAVTELGIDDIVRGWGEPKHRPELGVKLPTTVGAVYRLHSAYLTANRLMNEDN